MYRQGRKCFVCERESNFSNRHECFIVFAVLEEMKENVEPLKVNTNVIVQSSSSQIPSKKLHVHQDIKSVTALEGKKSLVFGDASREVGDNEEETAIIET